MQKRQVMERKCETNISTIMFKKWDDLTKNKCTFPQWNWCKNYDPQPTPFQNDDLPYHCPTAPPPFPIDWMSPFCLAKFYVIYLCCKSKSLIYLIYLIYLILVKRQALFSSRAFQINRLRMVLLGLPVIVKVLSDWHCQVLRIHTNADFYSL